MARFKRDRAPLESSRARSRKPPAPDYVPVERQAARYFARRGVLVLGKGRASMPAEGEGPTRYLTQWWAPSWAVGVVRIMSLPAWLYLLEREGGAVEALTLALLSDPELGAAFVGFAALQPEIAKKLNDPWSEMAVKQLWPLYRFVRDALQRPGVACTV